MRIEDKSTEFKREYVEDIKKTVIAFANTDGGELLIGVRPEGVFIRQGTSTVPATESAILAMIKETGGDCYEQTRSLNQQLAFEHAHAAFAKKASLSVSRKKERCTSLVKMEHIQISRCCYRSNVRI